MRSITVISCLILGLLSSCSNNVKSAINGWWSIDTIYYNGYDIKYCLWLNSLTFKNQTCEFAETNGYCLNINEKGEYGTWKLNTDSLPYTIEIRSRNKIFAGKHTIKFKRDDGNSLLKMEIESDSLYIVCRKGLFNYTANQELIDELVSQTNQKK